MDRGTEGRENVGGGGEKGNRQPLVFRGLPCSKFVGCMLGKAVCACLPTDTEADPWPMAHGSDPYDTAQLLSSPAMSCGTTTAQVSFSTNVAGHIVFFDLVGSGPQEGLCSCKARVAAEANLEVFASWGPGRPSRSCRLPGLGQGVFPRALGEVSDHTSYVVASRCFGDCLSTASPRT